MSLDNIIEMYKPSQRKTEEKVDSTAIKEYATEYKGLVLLEEKTFSGGTSIRYWM